MLASAMLSRDGVLRSEFLPPSDKQSFLASEQQLLNFSLVLYINLAAPQQFMQARLHSVCTSFLLVQAKRKEQKEKRKNTYHFD